MTTTLIPLTGIVLNCAAGATSVVAWRAAGHLPDHHARRLVLLLAVARVLGGDRLVAHRMTLMKMVDEDGDLTVAGAQVCEVRVGVRVFVTRGAFPVTRFGHGERRGRQGRARLGVSHCRGSSFA
ncbi:hypothetical protein [Streptomyces humi]|uniref:hypothetical protein n=1 Tax=Streptomyces humi TaxID=1428620 RepID=UPI0006288649|nr:hypothetical protein [Streptomyces humi]